MGAVFRPVVLTGAPRSLNRVVELRIRCHDEGRMTFRTESPAEETIKQLGIARLRIRISNFRNSQFAIRNH
jgi:hypothetical protein